MTAHHTFRKLSDKQIDALRILARHRDRKLTNGVTTEAVVNYTTAWTLEEHELARVGWRGGCERVWIVPAAKQLLEAQP